MRMKPIPPNPKLDRLISEARARYEAMTPAEREEQQAAQCASWVRGEIAWPTDCPYR